MDWPIVISLGALAIAALTFADRLLSNSLSIREHNEFKDNIENRFRELSRRVWRLENKRQNQEDDLG